ncbi:hypothetical protein HYR69_11690 [Candidatus Sumerlaeota bacterium]|nr:hypothetical protein [Candidatus Sumerlaeota bacterium]
MVEIAAKPIEELLERSAAAPGFKDAVLNLADGSPQELIRFSPGAPSVKVLRVVMKILEEWPDLPIESVYVQGSSGCSDFVGRAAVQPGGINFDFEWDCRWRAEQLGWMDAFGDPDQIRAARAYGYQCFRRIERAEK